MNAVQHTLGFLLRQRRRSATSSRQADGSPGWRAAASEACPATSRRAGWSSSNRRLPRPREARSLRVLAPSAAAAPLFFSLGGEGSVILTAYLRIEAKQLRKCPGGGSEVVVVSMIYYYDNVTLAQICPSKTILENFNSIFY